MFPKFIRVATVGQFLTEWINGSAIEKVPKVRVPNPRDVEELNVIAGALGFSYEVLFPPEGEGFGVRLPNGSFTGAFGMIQRGEADMIFGEVVMTEEAHEEFRLSYPYSIPEVTFMTRKHEYVPNPAMVLHPFSIQVWLAIAACAFLMPFVLHYLLRGKHSIPKILTSIIGSLVGQGIPLEPRRPREYVVLASWILSSALLYYFYAAVLLSFITFPSLSGIRTIEDLASGIKEGKYQCATYPVSQDAYVRSILLNPLLLDPSSVIIGKNLAENEGCHLFVPFLESLHCSVGDKKPVFVSERSEFLAYRDFYFISEDNFFFSPMAYVMHKEFCCAPELDKAVHDIWASGIFKILSDWANYKYLLEDFTWYGEYLERPPSDAKLTMTLLKGPFIFLIASHSLAFLVFLIEVFTGKLNRVRPF